MKRIDGIIVIVIALVFGGLSLGIKESRVGIQDRVGPGFFPVGIALLFLICGLAMFFRHDGVDHKQVWPSRNFWKAFGVLVGVFTLYGLFIESLGFFIVNTLVCLYLGVLLKNRWVPALLAGLLISASIFVIFSIILEINLPYGLLGFVEDWLYNY